MALAKKLTPGLFFWSRCPLGVHHVRLAMGDYYLPAGSGSKGITVFWWSHLRVEFGRCEIGLGIALNAKWKRHQCKSQSICILRIGSKPTCNVGHCWKSGSNVERISKMYHTLALDFRKYFDFEWSSSFWFDFEWYLQYFTMPPHSTWNMFHHINHILTDMDSTWIPHGFHMESTWSLCGVYADSTWIPCGIHVECT